MTDRNRITPEFITNLEPNQIFIFGSNLAGVHGAGAAKMALKWGAKLGQAEGLQGKTYAIPTKDKTIKRTLTIEEIKPYVDRFIEFAKKNKQMIFLVTPIGTGLAGMPPNKIAPLFSDAVSLDNVYLPKIFLDVLIKDVKTNKL